MLEYLHQGKKGSFFRDFSSQSNIVVLVQYTMLSFRSYLRIDFSTPLITYIRNILYRSSNTGKNTRHNHAISLICFHSYGKNPWYWGKKKGDIHVFKGSRASNKGNKVLRRRQSSHHKKFNKCHQVSWNITSHSCV